MSASQQSLYNDALSTYLGERVLASLSEARESRRLLDNVYATVLSECLEAGPWRHARRTVRLSASNTITPAFGYSYAFDVPADLETIYMVTVDGQENSNPYNAYAFEAGFLRANIDTLYVTYLSNDPSFGLKLSAWAPSFARYVAASLASRVVMPITQSAQKAEWLDKKVKDLRKAALSIDARNGPTRAQPAGTWTTSRRGGFSTYRDGSDGRIPS